MEDKLGAIFNIFHNLSTSQTRTQKQLDTVIFFPCQTPVRQEDHPPGFRGTVKPVLSDHSKTDKTKILMTNASLMKVESIVECSPWSILQYF